ncbi:MAG: DNA repair protein RecN [Ignavibacteria bacterium]|nr:DNA repair protein RecN [Ignavibacteria bacterium]
MIEKLFIKNYLIIKEAEINFSGGLNILTGETGAGKSIILDALGMILGERADYSLIRKDSDKMIIEGYFDFNNNKKVKLFLKDLEIENENGYIIIRRDLLKKGISRNFINDVPVNISDLKDLGNIIIDIHSQNEHQSLLNKETHIEILDQYINNNTLKNKYDESFSSLKQSIKEYEELVSRKDELAERKEFLEFQLKEINDINPLENEDDELETELNKMENSEEISTSLNTTLNFLYESDANVINEISSAVKELKKLLKYDESLEENIKLLEESLVNVKEVSNFLISYNENINFDAERIEHIRERLGSLNFLKKKYRLSVNEIIEKAKEIGKELNIAENFDYETEQAEKNIKEKRAETYKLAKEISDVRKKKSKELEKNITAILKEVGLESAEFKVNFDVYKYQEENLLSENKILLTSTGFDDIEFFIKTNKGSDFAPLKKSASGGEISRVMLAIKSVLSDSDEIEILVFDEIDSGISGKTADKVGKVLKKLSKSHQIISITHLPQIASQSDSHYFVSKKDANKETIAEIKQLSIDEKIIEIAKLISGDKITDSGIAGAKELINSAI